MHTHMYKIDRYIAICKAKYHFKGIVIAIEKKKDQRSEKFEKRKKNH